MRTKITRLLAAVAATAALLFAGAGVANAGQPEFDQACNDFDASMCAYRHTGDVEHLFKARDALHEINRQREIVDLEKSME